MNDEPKVTIAENRTELPRCSDLMACAVMATNYNETKTACEALFSLALDRPVTIVRRGDRIRVLLNTTNRRTLANGIVDAVRHFFGDPRFAPGNTADPAIIIERATAWAQDQPDADWVSPAVYAAHIVETVNGLLQTSSFDEAENNAIVNKVQEWYNKKMEQPQPLNDEQPGDPQEAAPDERRATIDTDKLKQLFKPVFFANDYIQRDTLEKKMDLSRFDVFVEHLEELLKEKRCYKKRIGGVAYMIHKSRFAAFLYHKNFAATCRVLFESCNLETPKDTSTNKYSDPAKDLLQLFAEIAYNPQL